MAYIYLLSFPHRWRYRPYPFSLSLHSLTYITRQQINMAASRVATRPGNARSANPLFGERPSQKYIRWAFPYPRPKYIRRGRNLPYPNLWASAEPLPWGSSGVIANPLFGEAVEPLPIPNLREAVEP